MSKYIVTVLGQDQPGIIAAVARSLYDIGCNIENISQTILQTEFAGIFIASPTGELTEDYLEAALKKELTDFQINVHVKQLEPEIKMLSPIRTEPFVVTTIGQDQTGLVYNIAQTLADAGVNITNLKAVFQESETSPRYLMMYEIDIPIDKDRQELNQKLRQTAAELGLEITIQHKNIFEKTLTI